MPTTSRKFDIGNFTIDTRAYSLPSNAGLSNPETLEWSWNDSEKTLIMIDIDTVGPKHPELLNISDEDYSAWFVKNWIMIYYSAIDGKNLTWTMLDDFNKNWASLNAVLVQKPLSGYIVISANHPTIKIYVGVIDRYHYLVIFSSESDEMLALIMRELKIYPKEESSTARLQSIQKML